MGTAQRGQLLRLVEHKAGWEAGPEELERYVLSLVEVMRPPHDTVPALTKNGLDVVASSE